MKRQPLQEMVLGHWIPTCRWWNYALIFPPYQNHSKWTKDPSLRPEILKVWETDCLKYKHRQVSIKDSRCSRNKSKNWWIVLNQHKKLHIPENDVVKRLPDMITRFLFSSNGLTESAVFIPCYLLTFMKVWIKLSHQHPHWKCWSDRKGEKFSPWISISSLPFHFQT